MVSNVCICHIFFGIPTLRPQSGNPKIGTILVPKLWTLISFSNQVFLELVKEIFYSFQENLSNNVLHTLIRYHLIVVIKGFVTLDPNFSFDHNWRILGLNEQCKNTLSIYTSKKFQWYLRGPIWCLFAFPTKALNN